MMKPDGSFKTFWNILMVVLLLYTATYVPYRTAFIDDTSTGMLVFETFIDFLFFMDIFVNFFTALELPDNKLETSRCKIAKSYVTSWFLLDLAACIPF